MRDSQPSATAQRVAIRRAAHQLLDHPLVLDDPLAVRIIGPASREAMRNNPRHFDRSPLAPFLRAFFAVRHRVAEDALAAGIARGVRQYVVLGAGLDTFAYRSPYSPNTLRIFEVDAPSTQAWKRERLAEAGIAIPENLTFVPVDFEHQVWGEQLEVAGFDPTVPTVFAWLGVSMYLTLESVFSTLRYIVSATEGGGGVVFDYGRPPATLPLVHRLIQKRVAARVASVGEPFVTYFETDDLVAQLRSLGFTDVVNLDGRTLTQRYFANRSDRLRVGPVGQVMTAFRWP